MFLAPSVVCFNSDYHTLPYPGRQPLPSIEIEREREL